jgi:hypothetical protein
VIFRIFPMLSVSLLSVASAATPSASSEYRDSDNTRFPASHAFDGKMTTAWIQADDDEAPAPFVELRLDRVTDIESVSVWFGDLSRGTRSMREGSRARTLTVTLTGGAEEVTVSRNFRDQAADRPERLDIPVVGDARTVRVTVDEVFEGVVSRRIAITEVGVNHVTGEWDQTPGVSRLNEWVNGTAGARAAERDAEDVAELITALADEEDVESAREARAELMERVANGAPFIQAQADRYISMGFRTLAVPPQQAAIESLYDLLDPGVIPALEAAALRSVDRQERQMWAAVEKYQAYGELRGGQRTNVPAWGQEGWSRGQLRTFDEPLQLEIDQFGLVYVADIANNRIQRFNERGSVDSAWGSPEPGVGNEWIDGTRRYYAAGSEAGSGPGAFTTTLDVTIIPGKEGDGFAAIDALGQVQVFNAEGTPTASWRIPTSAAIYQGLGGQVYLEYGKKKLVAIWGNQGYVFKIDGTELGNFELEDGTPSGAMMMKNGKLGVIYQQDLILYSLDGFRYGSIMGPELSEGFESWDVAVDNEGRLWALTDTGWLYKFKKPGKKVFEWHFTETPVSLPRIDVHDGRVFLSQGNSIQVIDALEEMARLEAAAEAGE